MDHDAFAPDDVAGRLAAVIGQVSRRIRPTSGELSMGHFSTLATIARSGPQRPGKLARFERVSAPTMTRIVARLEERGLVRREQDATDARAITVDVTAEGLHMVAEVRAERRAAVAALLEVLDDGQFATVRAALDALEAVGHRAAGPDEQD